MLFGSPVFQMVLGTKLVEPPHQPWLFSLSGPMLEPEVQNSLLIIRLATKRFFRNIFLCTYILITFNRGKDALHFSRVLDADQVHAIFAAFLGCTFSCELKKGTLLLVTVL